MLVSMWIFDSYYKGCVELWGRKTGLRRASAAYPPSFYMHLQDPAAHREMIEALESMYRVEECSFRTIFGTLCGHRIYAGRRVAEKIEIQTRYDARLYNVDVRQDQRYMAEMGLFPCGDEDESRFSSDFEIPLTSMEIMITGEPSRPGDIKSVKIQDSRNRRLEGPQKAVISDLMELIRSHDPDLILLPYADSWVPALVRLARRYGLTPTFSRSGRFKQMASKSYWSYGKVNYKDGALIPEGRILIDTARSFAYSEGGLEGVIAASRLSGLPPNLASRFTPGTLISSYEVFEALGRGISVPFRKGDAEIARSVSDLRDCDKGGMMFQPEPGVYEDVHQIDFTSLYPTIIVKYNLSPETVGDPQRSGFLSTVLSPLLRMRIETKKLKKINPAYAGMDSVLKWMLVTCFGYTGYRNAKFGQIRVHERITEISRELLVQIKELAEGMDLEVLHGIVDCLWVLGGPIDGFKEAVEKQTGILTEVDSYDWIAFLPMADGSGAYNRYFGRLYEGKMKVRGVMSRKRDTPEYIRRMQEELFEVLAKARCHEELKRMSARAEEVHRRYRDGLADADVNELAIHRRVSRLSYSRRCAEASAVQAYLNQGVSLAPGMEIGYVVRDAVTWAVDLEDRASAFDAGYYEKMLEKAWDEAAFVFATAQSVLGPEGVGS
ncbi:MAG: DNA polymerase [Methanosaeta sp. PtaB.Bin039]|nr:MAG: DNA polymerase [Methanosaeta sp. PtaB.Bin039]HQF17617.1 type B DNA-directed DNA polymerase [Methanotrichaceae archaeon]